VLSILWAHAFLVMLAYWALCLVVGVTPPGASPIPNAWGMAVATACLAQLGFGVRLDRRYDRKVTRSFWIAPLYPLGYWLLMSAVTVRSTLPALLRPQPSVARWASVREPRRTAVPVPSPRTADATERLSARPSAAS
jgi:hypothetical protein